MIVFHEQVIRTLAALAGYDLTYADHVRRHLDDAEMLPGLRADFLERAIGRGVDPAAAEQTWDDVSQFASFGFCKAHAAAFAVPTYRSAWLKTHYRAQFLAGILTHDPGMYPRRLLLDDARRAGVPDPAAGRASQRARLRHGRDRRRRPGHPHRPAGRARDLGGRSPFDPDREVRAPVRRHGGLPAAHHGVATGRRGASPRRGVRCVARRASFAPVRGDHGRGATRGRPADPHRATAPRHAFPEYSDAEVVRAELDVFGMDATRHLVSFYEPLLQDLGVTRAADLSAQATGGVGDGRRGEDRLPDPGGAQRPADHLRLARRRLRARSRSRSSPRCSTRSRARSSTPTRWRLGTAAPYGEARGQRDRRGRVGSRWRCSRLGVTAACARR